MGHVYVAEEKAFLEAVTELNRAQEIAFDTEGVHLSRTGSLTLASFLVLGRPAVLYLIDVQVLGAQRVFSQQLPSLKAVLENPNITKVTFDCRTDSDALFHQFGVSLT